MGVGLDGHKVCRCSLCYGGVDCWGFRKGGLGGELESSEP
jgi:hypothetical protein